MFRVFRSALLASCLLTLSGLSADAQNQASDTPPAANEQLDEVLARALVQHEAGDLLGAIQYYEVALQMAPDRPDIRSNLGAAYVGLGQIDNGIEQYRKALEAGEDPTIRLNLALALYKAGRLAAATPEFERVLASDAGNKQAALLLADCLLQAGRDQAVVELLSPREADFTDDLAYAYLLGTALLKTGDTQRGEVLIDRIFSKGESAEGHLLLGMAYLNRRDYQNAVTELAKAVELNPALAAAHVMHGRALLASGDRERAMRAFRTALAQEPDSFEANLQLGTLYRLDQRFDDAMLYLRRAAAIRPDDLALRHQLAATHLGMGDAERARELLEGVVKEAPDFVDGHVLLATTYYRLKRKEDGDRERVIIDRLNAERQARQPGAVRAEELERAETSGAQRPAEPPKN